MKIPVSLEIDGKHFTGHLTSVSGAGVPNTWHLLLNGNFYYGALHLLDRWVFHGNTHGKRFETIAEELGQMVVAWYQ
jgi:hypothetical protein